MAKIRYFGLGMYGQIIEVGDGRSAKTMTAQSLGREIRSYSFILYGTQIGPRIGIGYTVDIDTVMFLWATARAARPKLFAHRVSIKAVGKSVFLERFNEFVKDRQGGHITAAYMDYRSAITGHYRIIEEVMRAMDARLKVRKIIDDLVPDWSNDGLIFYDEIANQIANP